MHPAYSAIPRCGQSVLESYIFVDTDTSLQLQNITSWAKEKEEYTIIMYRTVVALQGP